MPGFNNAVSVFFCKFLCACKISDLESVRFPQLYPVLNIKNRFRPGFPNVHMNWSVIVAVKTEFEAILFKNNRHGLNILHATSLGDIFLRTSKIRCGGIWATCHAKAGKGE